MRKKTEKLTTSAKSSADDRDQMYGNIRSTYKAMDKPKFWLECRKIVSPPDHIDRKENEDIEVFIRCVKDLGLTFNNNEKTLLPSLFMQILFLLSIVEKLTNEGKKLMYLLFGKNSSI